MKYTYQFKAKCDDCGQDIWTGILGEELDKMNEAEAMGEDSETSWMPYANSNSACDCDYPVHKFGTVVLVGIEEVE